MAVAFDNKLPNVVAFGDSNEYVFGPALQQVLARAGFSPSQIVVKYRESSRPRNWLRASDALYDGDFGELWRTRDEFDAGPPVAEALSPATVLVEIGLGGNLGLSSSEQRSVGALVQQVLRFAPRAQIVWRGVPPATASHSGAVAPPSTKLGRYERNALLKRVLAPLGFTVVGPGSGNAAGLRRAYVDVMAMHAGGPAPGDTTTVGTEAARAYERAVLQDAHDAASVAGEQPAAGPWREFVRGRDAMSVHVPSDAALALVERHLAPLGLLPLQPPVPAPGAYATDVIVDDAYVRDGPPGFQWRKPQLIPRGTPLMVVQWQSGYGRVVGLDNKDWSWTSLANLSFRG